jgi:2-oxoglutarate ferredoxin oxidoreductase subunit beta
VTKAQPEGTPSSPFNPILVSVAMQAGFVARGFAGMIDHLSELIREGVAHRGLALIDVLQPCVSFNKVNTFAWYKERCKLLPEEYDPTDWEAAIKVGKEWGDRIPIGIIYRNDRVPFEDHFAVLDDGPLLGREIDREMLQTILDVYA